MFNLDKFKDDVNNIYNKCLNNYICRQNLHNQIQMEIYKLGYKYELKPQIEYIVDDGRIDVVYLHHNIFPYIAIEIDSALREKSIEKLLTINVKYKIWVYYGIRTLGSKFNIPDQIKVIRLKKYRDLIRI